jgi:hypothetical protein
VSALAISLIVFACVLAGAALGMVLREVLPKHHVSEESKDIIKLGTGLLATLAALVLGLLIASAKSSFDVKSDELKQSVARIILLDRSLRHYGPEANEVRDLARRLVTAKAELIWMEVDTTVGAGLGRGAAGIEEVQDKLRALAPTNDAQRWLQTRALQISSELALTRWLVIEQSGSSIPMPFLVVLVFWLAVIFASFGLFAPRHGTVYAVIFACALSISSAIFLIVELDQPFEGMLKISDWPIRDAVAEMNR